MNNRAELRKLLSTPYETAQYYLHCGRISQRVFDRYWRLWVWSAVRLSSVAAAEQNYRPDAVQRINRVKRALELARAESY